MSDGQHLVVFREGVHYVIGDDGDADLSQPLRWTGDGWRPAVDGEPLHNDVHHIADLELEVGGEE